jgi:putative spermidine/putrescine transport system permease protein
MSLMAVDRRIEEAALVHGASPLRVFWRITLPLIRPGIIAGGVIAFLISFDETTISLFIVSVKTSTLPTEIYRYLEYSTDPQIAALSVVLILISVAVVVVLERLVGLRKAV